jgi:hypothetical protein
MRILFIILNSKLTTILLCLILGLIVGGTSFYAQQQSAEASLRANVMYLVPKDSARVERNLTHSTLFESSDPKVGYTSDWDVIRQQVNNNQLNALVIHHAALESVNQKELRQWFRYGLVIAGIGIPAKQLANVLDMPDLNVWGDQEIYKTPSYFYIFSLRVKASPQDRQKILSGLKTNGIDAPADGIQGSASVTEGASTDSLLTDAGRKRFASVLKEHIEDMNKP